MRHAAGPECLPGPAAKLTTPATLSSAAEPSHITSVLPASRAPAALSAATRITPSAPASLPGLSPTSLLFKPLRV